MKKIYVVGGAEDYANWLCQIGFVLTRDKLGADVVMFTGGEDVSPYLYGHSNLASGNNVRRDNFECEIFAETLSRGIPMIGVCRGSQFLGAMSGAQIVQDMNHPYYHEVETFDGKKMVANSTHHQAVFIPNNLKEGEDYKLLAWANNLSGRHLLDDETVVFGPNYKETECTWWPKTKCFGIQSHPENTLGSDWNKWLQQEIVKYIPAV